MDEASDAPYGPLSWQDTNRPKKGSRDRLPGSPETPDVLTARYSEWRWDLAWHHVPQALTYRLTKRSEEALCCGWVDSLVRRLDDDLFARKFTPRKATSAWSTRNRRRYTNLQSRGLLAPPGLERAPTDKSGDAPRPSVIELHSYIEDAFRADQKSWQFFGQLAPSYRRDYIGWIDSAKRQTTKEKRLREALELLADEQKLPLR